MTRALLRKDQIKSIILCKDRDFKRKAVIHLNNCGFTAEKLVVDDMKAALLILERDLDIENFVIEATQSTPDEISKMIELFQKRSGSTDVRLIMYLDELYQARQKDEIAAKLPKALICFLPLQQLHFTKFFLSPRAPTEPAKTSSSEAASKTREKEKEKEKEAEKDGAALTLIEASAHIKATVEQLNALGKDRTRLDIVRDIGQRFNGVMGTFAFFKQKDGFASIKELATVIDDVARSYQEPAVQATLSERHWQLLMESAKTIYLILKDLRENRPITPAYTARAQTLFSHYQKDSSLRRRASQSQDEIDRLVELANDELLKQSS